MGRCPSCTRLIVIGICTCASDGDLPPISRPGPRRPRLYAPADACILIALPAVVYDFATHGAKEHQLAWFVGGVFVVLSLPISLYEGACGRGAARSGAS